MSLYFLLLLFFRTSFHPIVGKDSKQIVKKVIKQKQNFVDLNFIEESPKFIINTGNSVITVINCLFYFNAGEDEEPGALSASGNFHINISSSRFIGNKAKASGGAILLDAQEFDIKDCIFQDNRCFNPSDKDSNGGAIFFNRKSDKHIIDSCTFENNSAKSYGGSIFVRFEPTSKSKLLDIESPIKILNCQFIKSTSLVGGGALSSGSFNPSGAVNDGDMEIESCTFIECSSGAGGAIYFHDGTKSNDEEKLFYNCTFDNNKASHKGGCIYSLTFNLTLHNITFKNNEGESLLYIMMDEQAPTIDDVIFENNAGTTFEIVLLHIDQMVFTNCVFRDYPAGQIFNSTNIVGEGVLRKFIRCNFTGCEGNVLPPINILSGTFSFQECNFSYNKKGTILVGGNSFAYFDDCDFENNENDNGGAIKVTTSSELTAINCRFNGNKASEW